MAEKIEENMQSLGKSNISFYTKGKAFESEEKGASKDPMEKVTDMIKVLVTIQNQLMEN